MIPGRPAPWGLLALVVLAAAPGLAHAQADILSRDTFSGVIDLRAGAADGEPSWTDGGFGKARFGDEAAITAQADLVWKPRLNWEWSGIVDLQAQPDQTHGVDLGEAFIRYKPVPHGDSRWSARAGLFYPPISLEHEGGAWIAADTITPSAINSWVGEELKVLGVETSLSHVFPAGEAGLTAGVFYYGDTAGTLVSLRGWSMSDLKSSAGQRFTLPPLSPFMRTKQAAFTSPVKEIDGRAGWYAQGFWRANALSLDVLYYDNKGDRVSVDADREWAWDTRLWSAGATWTLNPKTTLRAQAMRGVTYMGRSTPAIWIDAGYRAGYVMLTRQMGQGSDALSARLDAFEVTDHSWKAADPNRETGWALTAAWRHPLNNHADLLLEAMRIDTTGRARLRTGETADQQQTVVQSALRLKF